MTQQSSQCRLARSPAASERYSGCIFQKEEENVNV